MAKHLIIIHGRATKPSEKEKKRLVIQALKHGLDRVDPSGRLSGKIGGDIKFSFAYYGDISNQLLYKSQRKYLTDTDPKYNTPCEAHGSYDDDLATLLSQTNFSKAAYKTHLKANKDRRYMDELASAASMLGNFIGLNDELIARATPDMGAYLMTRKTGSAVRERLQKPLIKALTDGDDICLVAHSMGCIVSYDVMWKLSNMSEYRDVKETGNSVKRWITLGNPLGEPGVIKNLYDSNEGADGKYPRNIIKDWINITATDDFVAHDGKIANDFKEMVKQRYVQSITDLPEIYNFWCGYNGTNAHKFYGYLDHPVVAGEIGTWMRS